MNAIIFPGQGSQYPGMGRSLYEGFAEARNVFCAFDRVLGYSFSQTCFAASADELKETSLQQLAIVAASLAAYEVFRTKGIAVDCLSGLSLGECSCLYAAGAVSLDNLIVLVRERAAAMQRAAGEVASTMFAVIGADPKLLAVKAKELGFYLANINSPQQVAISLEKQKRAAVKEGLEREGMRVVELEVSGGFHCPFMEPAKAHLSAVMSGMEVKDAFVPIVSNVTARGHTGHSELRANLIAQLVNPVLWNECVEFMVRRGTKVFYEVGPSKVLRGLMRKIAPALEVVNLDKAEDFSFLG